MSTPQEENVKLQEENVKLKQELEQLKIPASKADLANLPTPLDRWNLPGALPEMWIKRDDQTGLELSGNKIRKLEFLLADAKAKGHDCVITTGGIQSNHTRATAVASRIMGLDAYLILRTEQTQTDPGMAGNLLPSRLAGAHIRLVNGAPAQPAVLASLEEELTKAGKNPYVFPSGGSNTRGAWGYIEAIAELEAQMTEAAMSPFDVLYFACGSGGTAAGLALANELCNGQVAKKVVGIAVDDDAATFYDKIDTKIYPSLFTEGYSSPKSAKDMLHIEELTEYIGGKTNQYGVPTQEQLSMIAQVAKETGVVLDPVYTGKGVFGMREHMKKEGLTSEHRVLFLHTGGILGSYVHGDALLQTMKDDKHVEDGEGVGWEALKGFADKEPASGGFNTFSRLC